MNSTLQVRINRETKRQAQKVFKRLGLDMSSGVKLYLSQVVEIGGIPFVPRTKNGFTENRERKLLREAREALKRKKYFSDARSLHSSFDE